MSIIYESQHHVEVRLTAASIERLRTARVFFEDNLNRRRLQEGGVLHFGTSVEVEPYTGYLAGDTLWSMGAFSYSSSALFRDMKIGRYCSIAWNVVATVGRHPIEAVTSSSVTYDRDLAPAKSAMLDAGVSEMNWVDTPQKPLPLIGNDVWIAASVALAPGITVGDGSVIAANSVVTKDVPPYAIVGGNPAEIIRYRFDDELIARLADVKWWRFFFPHLAGFEWKTPHVFLDQVQEAEANGRLVSFEPKPLNLRELLG